MDMGILKPFDLSRTALSGVSVEGPRPTSWRVGKRIFSDNIGSARGNQTRRRVSAPAEIAQLICRRRCRYSGFCPVGNVDINFSLDDTSGPGGSKRDRSEQWRCDSSDSLRKKRCDCPRIFRKSRSLLFEAEALSLCQPCFV